MSPRHRADSTPRATAPASTLDVTFLATVPAPRGPAYPPSGARSPTRGADSLVAHRSYPSPEIPFGTSRVANADCVSSASSPGLSTSLASFSELPLGMLLDALADRVVARMLDHPSAPRHPEHASARENPLGTARAFLDAGRRGDFPTFKRGREVVARWTDVVAYIERRTVARKERPAPPPLKHHSFVELPAPPPHKPHTPPRRTRAAAQPNATPTRRNAPASPDDRRRELLRAAKILPPNS